MLIAINHGNKQMKTACRPHITGRRIRRLYGISQTGVWLNLLIRASLIRSILMMYAVIHRLMLPQLP